MRERGKMFCVREEEKKERKGARYRAAVELQREREDPYLHIE